MFLLDWWLEIIHWQIFIRAADERQALGQMFQWDWWWLNRHQDRWFSGVDDEKQALGQIFQWGSWKLNIAPEHMFQWDWSIKRHWGNVLLSLCDYLPSLNCIVTTVWCTSMMSNVVLSWAFIPYPALCRTQREADGGFPVLLWQLSEYLWLHSADKCLHQL